MQKIQRTIEIKAPVQQVYDYLNQPTTLLSIWPNIVSVSNIVPRSAERDLDTMLGNLKDVMEHTAVAKTTSARAH
jgi:carbon monoxide dehydrogenase subunit G